jgi:NAD+ synthase (glutamine-hydrolysing)
MKIAMAQINPTIADVTGNTEKIISFIERARSQDADIVIFPEMATMGYPPMDLLENKKLVEDNLASIGEVAGHAKEISVICGFVDFDKKNQPMLYNAAAFMRNGTIISRHYKTLLPTYDVFDEQRYFLSCKEQTVVKHMERRIGITVCEDIWNAIDQEDNKFIENRRYDIDPIKILVDKGTDILVSINASPFMRGKNRFKRIMLAEIARKNSLTVVYVNQVGGNDSLVFDGNSVIYNQKGKLIGHARPFDEDLVVVDDSSESEIKIRDDEIEDIHRALILGIRDYVHKCGFRKVVIGLSGGIDSALTAVLAVQALGPENVTGVSMPSAYSSAGSIEDSQALARNLGIRLEVIPIKELFDRYRKDLAQVFEGKPEDSTEENIQARVRGNLLMAISNKEKSLVLSTGNKSELAMGYCTLYGDMSGGLAAISDLPKTLVYELARHVNSEWRMIPDACFTKPPSAELRENQTDQDTLPPYEVLDQILDLYIEERRSAEEIVGRGYPEELVRSILHTVNINEYKRRQAAPGIKVTAKAFGVGRRIPIAQGFRP